MTRKKRPGRPARWILIGCAVTTLVAAAVVIGYGLRLSNRIEERFAGRRWQLPSTVYSDVTLLYPGLSVNRQLMTDLLGRLDYRAVDRLPDRPGEMRVSEGRWELFLHSLKTPDRERSPFPVAIGMNGSRIVSIRRLDDNRSLPLLELEPEAIDLFFGPEREKRRLVAIDQVPEHLIQSVLAAEDNRFFDHHGIDFRGIARAAVANLRHGEVRQGGSTITQQLAKNYFLTAERTLVRKLREMLIALILEWQYDKRTILEIYFNEIYLGQMGSISINGVGEASRFYFDKPVEALELSESAMLAGIIKGPNAYSPHLHPERCRARRQVLLDQMKRSGTINQQEWETARKAPLAPAAHRPFSKRAPYFVDYLSRQLEAFYSPEDLTSLGLSIFTTLDTQVQQAAEASLQNGLAALESANPELLRKSGSPLQGALVVIQPRTGAVLAMVGGRDYAASQFNRVTMARRQAGSTFKPFVYLAAFDRKTAVSVLPNLPTAYTVDGKEWQPGNFSDINRRALRLREALAQSVNRPTVYLAMEIGIEKVVATASAFGFSTTLPLYPSVALGAVEVIPIELARAYGVFAAEGILALPMSIRDVLSGTGAPLQRQSVELVQTISPAKAYLMTSLLKSVITEGTGKGIVSRGIGFPVAGKTGTTNDYRDAWFIGYTPDALILVWVGFDDGASINASGAAASLPIWAELARSIPHRFTGLDFVQPPGIVVEEVCLEDTEGRSPWPCQEIREEVFLEGVGPGDSGLTGPGALIKRLLKGLKGGGGQN